VLILLQLSLHVGYFFVLVHRLLVKLIRRLLVLLELGLLHRNRPLHGLKLDSLLIELGFVFSLLRPKFLVYFLNFEIFIFYLLRMFGNNQQLFCHFDVQLFNHLLVTLDFGLVLLQSLFQLRKFGL
jgi:hypothetical protein